jgi:hypothetical protein
VEGLQEEQEDFLVGSLALAFQEDSLGDFRVLLVLLQEGSLVLVQQELLV